MIVQAYFLDILHRTKYGDMGLVVGRRKEGGKVVSMLVGTRLHIAELKVLYLHVIPCLVSNFNVVKYESCGT